MKPTRKQKQLLGAFSAFAAFLILFYGSQRLWAHRTGYFSPDYPQILLTQHTDFETVFLQTGLGRPAVEKLLSAGEFQTVGHIQNRFFLPPKAKCTPLLGWFTWEDRLSEDSGIPLIDLQPGDILLTLSTHTAGWRHGHAGLVLDSNTVLESTVLGSRSTPVSAAHWSTYSNYAVVRIKNVTPELQRQVANYGLEHLTGIPYRLLSGLIGPKAPPSDAPWFGLHCSYLVWYAWNHFGYDLDSDGGRLVTAQDLLHSDLVEIVQISGMDPRIFLTRSQEVLQ